MGSLFASQSVSVRPTAQTVLGAETSAFAAQALAGMPVDAATLAFLSDLEGAVGRENSSLAAAFRVGRQELLMMHDGTRDPERLRVGARLAAVFSQMDGQWPRVRINLGGERYAPSDQAAKLLAARLSFGAVSHASGEGDAAKMEPMAQAMGSGFAISVMTVWKNLMYPSAKPLHPSLFLNFLMGFETATSVGSRPEAFRNGMDGFITGEAEASSFSYLRFEGVPDNELRNAALTLGKVLYLLQIIKQHDPNLAMELATQFQHQLHQPDFLFGELASRLLAIRQLATEGISDPAQVEGYIRTVAGIEAMFYQALVLLPEEASRFQAHLAAQGVTDLPHFFLQLQTRLASLRDATAFQLSADGTP